MKLCLAGPPRLKLGVGLDIWPELGRARTEQKAHGSEIGEAEREGRGDDSAPFLGIIALQLAHPGPVAFADVLGLRAMAKGS